MLAKLGKWLQSRFPEKLEVKIEEYKELASKVDQISDIVKRLELLEVRTAKVEANAVHKEPVQELIKHIQETKEEVNKLKLAQGIGQVGVNAEIAAMLNGLPLGGSNE